MAGLFRPMIVVLLCYALSLVTPVASQEGVTLFTQELILSAVRDTIDRDYLRLSHIYATIVTKDPKLTMQIEPYTAMLLSRVQGALDVIKTEWETIITEGSRRVPPPTGPPDSEDPIQTGDGGTITP